MGVFALAALLCVIGAIVEYIKEKRTPVIPAEYWANKELYHQDIMDGVPIEQRMENLRNGKYRLEEKHPEPHRDKNGRIIIENCKLYEEDLERHGPLQAQKWASEGKYNLEPEELEQERERIRKEIDDLYKI